MISRLGTQKSLIFCYSVSFLDGLNNHCIGAEVLGLTEKASGIHYLEQGNHELTENAWQDQGSHDGVRERGYNRVNAWSPLLILNAETRVFAVLKSQDPSN